MDAAKSVTAMFDPTGFVTVVPIAVGGHGTIDPGTNTLVKKNKTKRFKIKPDIGYHIGSVTGCNGTLVGSSYTTGPITQTCTVTATFAINSYIVTPAPKQNGGISPNTGQSVDYGNTASFTVTPETGYHIKSVSGCGGTWDGIITGGTYTTGPITKNCTVKAAFEINTYTVYPDSHGRTAALSPSTVQTVKYHTRRRNSRSEPNKGYLIDSVTGCNGTVSGQLLHHRFDCVGLHNHRDV